MSASGALPPPSPFAELSATLFARHRSLDEALSRIAEVGRDALTNCVAASITVIDRGHPATLGSTGELAVALDASQYAAGRGPCLEAARTSQTTVVDDTRSDRRWVRFSTAAERVGVRSSLSVPMELHGQDVVGGFNAYAVVPTAFDERGREVGELFTAQAGAVVSNARAYWSAEALSRNLTAALETRGVIEQAKGVLVATLRISPDEAFEELRRRSQRENRKLNDLAAEIVADAAGA
jgi:GAF domain-containing protein